jgi:N-acetylglutamate synthase and related acetyltransferases
MVNLIRTGADNPDFIFLVNQLDADLAIRDGEEHSFYAQFNKIDKIRYVVVAYEGDQPVGCGAVKEFSADAMELKRMYVSPHMRNAGVATRILAELELWTKELSYKRCILETGKKQPEAIALYKKNGYNLVSNYGQYAGIENSLCFEKILT